MARRFNHIRKAMEPVYPIGSIVAMTLMTLLVLLLAACSDDDEPMDRQSLVMEASASASAYDEVTETPAGARRATEAWTPPTSYYLYENSLVNGLFSNQRNLTDNTISLFLAQGTDVKFDTKLRKSGDKWKLAVEEKDFEKVPGTYQAYGFIPRDAATGKVIAGKTVYSEIALLSTSTTYADGAVLHIYGLKAVTPADVSVIIGAKEGSDPNHDGNYTDTNGDGKDDAGDTWVDRICPGKFDITINNGNNYLFLLFEHLYSALRFRFKVAPDYNQLRTIVLKKVELRADYGYANYDATITLEANDTRTSPIVGSPVFTPRGDAADFVTIFEAKGAYQDGLTLTPGDYTALMGGFVPGDNLVFTLRTTYDVYDKNGENGNLVRKDCMADNKIVLTDIIASLTGVQRGKYYTVNLTVEPTYLYVLSDPDLNNPTVMVN